MHKINALIRKELGEIFSRDIDAKPGVFFTVTKVDTASDFEQSEVFIQAFPTSESHYVMKTLEHEHGALQKKLYKRLAIKKCPKIVFHSDYHGEYVEEIDSLLSH